MIGGVAGSSKHGRKAAWKFVRDNWEELHNRYQGGFLISRLIKVSHTWGECVVHITLDGLLSILFFFLFFSLYDHSY